MNAKLAAILLALLTFGLLEPAGAYWNKEWTLRKQITIDPGAAGTPITDPIGTVTLLLRLHDGNFNFAEAKDDGSDIRLVAGDDKTLLPHHIEKYDALLDEAFVWVKVPNLKANSKATIWLYYGNAKAPRAEDAKGTCDADTTLIYHWSETSAPPRDATAYGNNAEKSAVPTSGSLIGPGARLGAATSVSIPNSDSLTWQEGAAYTWSVWVKLGSGSNGALLSRSAGGASTINNEGKIFLDTVPVSVPELEQRLTAQKAQTPDFPVVIRGDTPHRDGSRTRPGRRHRPACPRVSGGPDVPGIQGGGARRFGESTIQRPKPHFV